MALGVPAQPLGRYEWRGPWSEQSDEWDAHPAVRKALKPWYADDGKFWMDFNDFKYVFGALRVTEWTPPSRRFRLEDAEDDEEGH